MKTVAIIVLLLVGVTLAIPTGYNGVDGSTEVSVNDPTVLGLINTAIEGPMGDSGRYKLIEVVAARRRSSPETQYDMEFIIGKTLCARGDEAAELCPIDPNGQLEKCSLRAWGWIEDNRSGYSRGSCIDI